MAFEPRRGGTARVAALGRSALAADRLFRKSLICGAASGEAFFVARAQRTKSVRIRGENAEDGDVKGKKPCDFVVK